MAAALCRGATTRPSDAGAERTQELGAALDKALAGRGWVELPGAVRDFRYAGPTPAGAPGPGWFITTGISGNSWPRADAQQEAAFVRSVEAAHAGRTRVIEGGIVLLADPSRRVWAVAEHTPHLLRCYDGTKWTYRRADGLPAADDEPGEFARLTAAGKLPRPQYGKGGLRDFNDLGRWNPAACADSAGNLHFVAGCNSRDAADSGAGGGGVHTLRPDGTWSFFRIYPPEMPRSSMPFEALRCVVHRKGAADLVTIAEFRLSDPVAAAHGQPVEPIPPGADALRRQQWKDHTDEPRYGPSYLLRFDGKSWRFDRSSVGWGVYDSVGRTWPQPDGSAYLANRFGLWVQWPPDVGKARLDRLIADLLEGGDAKRTEAAERLASMGKRAVPALRDAVEQASADRSKQTLGAVLAQAERVARGEEDAVPVVGGRWRFFRAYPQATMPDGRFAFICDRAVDVRAGGRETKDCLVFFDPAAGTFEVRPIDRAQWNATDFYDKRALEAPVKNLDGTVIDLDGGLWVPGGYRCGKDGRIERLTPPGLHLRLPHAVDADGRVYFYADAPNHTSLYAFRFGGAAPGVAGAPAGEREKQVEGVRGLFRQSDLATPWNAWAVQSRAGQRDRLLRLDGPEPTAVDLPEGLRGVFAVAPLDGGCVVTGRGVGPAGAGDAAGFWDGQAWDVAPDVKSLVERQGARLAKMAPPRAVAADTSAYGPGRIFEHHLLLASDGGGGLWLAEDAAGRTRRLWHWDGRDFVDLWSLLPLEPRRAEDGALMTADGGRVLLVHLEPDMGVRPGGEWAFWRATPEVAREFQLIPQPGQPPGLYVTLLAALGPNTIFSRGLWADRQGWVWSPLFSDSGHQWVRRRGARVGPTIWTRLVWQDAFAQGTDGPVWCVTGKMKDEPMVWADVSPTGDEPDKYPRMNWVGTHVPDMGAAARLAVAPDNKVYLLHEGGCSLLRLRKLGKDEQPKLPTRQVGPSEKREGNGDGPPKENWEIQEVARRAWDAPKNDFGRVAFDGTGVWFLPQGGPLIRAPLPRE